ncbi:unnamed protein product [Kluyveromyces dobzhanskii CBS 2104]|uniref:WGS project CCBQ000000000 data, contig 00015 n=1 Tax=Kluyveromyces dobzhanskii CBS 2104 TaxID=1427455 RepID=A0A0A8LC84_9SACH|nr:unnamed protein product [Kluyveromyces dobzhanskii CBS 2104]
MAEDILAQSKALDQLAKLIISQSDKKQSNHSSLKQEYETKLNNLDELITMITSAELDKDKFSKLISKQIEIVEKDGQEYALIPVHRGLKRPNSSKSKPKPNRIKCSYCKETGHLRSKCEKKLMGIPPL